MEVQTHFPEQVHWVLEQYQQIWINKDLVSDEAMSEAQLLA